MRMFKTLRRVGGNCISQPEGLFNFIASNETSPRGGSKTFRGWPRATGTSVMSLSITGCFTALTLARSKTINGRQ